MCNNIQKSPEFRQISDNTQKSGSKPKKAQARTGRPLQDLPLSITNNDRARKPKFGAGKENKSVLSSSPRAGIYDKLSKHKPLTTDNSSRNSNQYRTTTDSRKSVTSSNSIYKHSPLASAIHADSEVSLVATLRKEVDSLRDNLKHKEVELKDSLVCIEDLQRSLKGDNNNNNYSNLDEAKHIAGFNNDTFGNLGQVLRSLRVENEQLRGTLR